MKVVLILGILVVAYLGYAGFRFYTAVQISKKLVEEAVSYEKVGDDVRTAVLVLGDSTAVGVGADTPEDTVAGRTSAYLDATSVENYAVSGAQVEDLPGQIERAKHAEYRLILIHIGANDIIQLHSPTKTANSLKSVVETLPTAERIIISAGDVGGAPLFPSVIRPFYTKRTILFHDAFTQALAESRAMYVNLYASPSREVINKNPDIYLAADGLHLSSKGYELWFKEIQPYL